jgi:hypothetical protein
MRDSRGSSSSTNEAASRASSGACTQFAEVISQDKMKVRQIDPGRVLKQIYACLPFDLHSECGCNRYLPYPLLVLDCWLKGLS